MWVQGQTGNSSSYVKARGDKQDIFFTRKIQITRNAGINNNLQKETFSIYTHRNIYQNFRGEYIKSYLNKMK